MKKNLFAVFTAIALLCITGCASTSGLTVSQVKKASTNGDFLSPKEGALVFGYNEIWNEFLQQNPELGYKFYKANWYDDSHTIVLVTIVNSLAFLEPLPLGSELKLYSTTGYVGDTRQTTYYGIAGVDLVLNKPGLVFYGAYSSDKDRDEAELSALKLLLNYFKGTGSEWETEILNRMEELNNAK